MGRAIQSSSVCSSCCLASCHSGAATTLVAWQLHHQQQLLHRCRLVPQGRSGVHAQPPAQRLPLAPRLAVGVPATGEGACGGGGGGVMEAGCLRGEGARRSTPVLRGDSTPACGAIGAPAAHLVLTACTASQLPGLWACGVPASLRPRSSTRCRHTSASPASHSMSTSAAPACSMRSGSGSAPHLVQQRRRGVTGGACTYTHARRRPPKTSEHHVQPGSKHRTPRLLRHLPCPVEQRPPGQWAVEDDAVPAGQLGGGVAEHDIIAEAVPVDSRVLLCQALESVPRVVLVYQRPPQAPRQLPRQRALA